MIKLVLQFFANAISRFAKYVPMLDEVYQVAAVTSVLDGAAELATQGANADELVIPKLDMQGLADYDRNSGYVAGDVTLTNETVKCNFDRGRMFNVDTMDNEETAGIAFGRLSGEFIRTKVAPELDAFRLATYAGVSGISTVNAAVLDTGEKVIAALNAADVKMTNDEVPQTDRHLFINPTLLGLVNAMDTTKSKAVLAKFASIKEVPAARFYTKIKQKDGTTTGEEAGGFAKDAAGVAINFMVIHKPAVIQFQKHIAPKVITPEQNQTADGWKFGYRNVGIADVYENKVAGIYLHKATA